MKNVENLLLSGLVAVILFISLPLHAEEKQFFVLPKGKAGRDTNFFSLDKEDGRSAFARAKDGMNAMSALAAQDRAREEKRVFQEAALALAKSQEEAAIFKAKIKREQAERQAAWNAGGRYEEEPVARVQQVYKKPSATTTSTTTAPRIRRQQTDEVPEIVNQNDGEKKRGVHDPIRLFNGLQ